VVFTTNRWPSQRVEKAETFCFADRKSLFQLIKNAAGSIELINCNGLLDQHLLS
jgi:hypothetical protein